MRRAAALLLLVAAAGADDALLERWNKPRRESFDLRSAWPEHVIEEIAKRYGVPFELDAAGVERADFVAKDVTFFEALDRFAAVHGLGVAGVPGGGATDWGPGPLVLVRPDDAVRTVAPSYIGASRLSVQRVSVLAVRRFAGAGGPARPFVAPEEPALRVDFRWLTEPGFEGAALVAWELGAAEDDVGNRMTMAQDSVPRVPANEGFAIDFRRPPPAAKSIRKLEGTVRVALPTERGKVEFLAPEVGQTKKLGGARLTFLGMDAERRTVKFKVKGSPCAGLGRTGVDLHVGPRDWTGHGWDPAAIAMRPYDADAVEISEGSQTSSSWGLFQGTTFEIELAAVPARIEFEAFVRGVKRDLPFSFKDIPVPE